MSHIVKGRIAVGYTDKENLVNALTGGNQLPPLGKVFQDAPLYRVGAGMTRETYDLVLVDASKDKNRLGFSQERGIWQQFQEDYGSVGEWTRKMSALIQDRYLAFHYEKQAIEQGYNAQIVTMPNGGFEVHAEEALATW